MSYHCISGVFGTLELYGQPHSVYHTKLAATAAAGSNTLTLAHSVDWNVSTSLFRQILKSQVHLILTRLSCSDPKYMHA